MPNYQAVCPANQIPEGQARMFVIAEQMLAIFHVGGDFYALDNHCPHAGASLADGNLDGDIVSCRIHHWRFCVRDGRYLDEDKPYFDARTFPLRLSDGMIEVALEKS